MGLIIKKKSEHLWILENIRSWYHQTNGDKRKKLRKSISGEPVKIRKYLESEKKDKYLDLAWELKKLWNMKVTIISIVIGALGIVIKRLIQELEEWK